MSDLPETSCIRAPIVLHMHKKFQVNRTKIKEGCQSYTKAAHQDSKSDLPLVYCNAQSIEGSVFYLHRKQDWKCALIETFFIKIVLTNYWTIFWKIGLLLKNLVKSYKKVHTVFVDEKSLADMMSHHFTDTNNHS